MMTSIFDSYSEMLQSKDGLKEAGAWHSLENILPTLRNLYILDLVSGYSWHCKYIAEHDTNSIVSIDISIKMIDFAEKEDREKAITYFVSDFEKLSFYPESFDLVFSSLALHYVENFDFLVKVIHTRLLPNGHFVFSIEHLIFTAIET